MGGNALSNLLIMEISNILDLVALLLDILSVSIMSGSAQASLCSGTITHRAFNRER